MSATPQAGRLAERCVAMAKAAADAAAWFHANPERAPDQTAGLDRDLRRMRVRAEKLGAAALRPMCVTVFGASQSGKSYLVSALAKNADGGLRVEIGARGYDFLTEINPYGDRESTGLVTRFGVAAIATPPSLPVAVRLLSQADVVRVVANGYIEEIKRDDARPLGPDEVTALLGALKAGPERPGFDDDDVFEMRDYFERHFRSHPVVAGLGPDFWRDAARLAPTLDAAGRARLFSPLWAGVEALTTLARRLIEGLDALGNPDEAFCEAAALLPRETSIIDVQTLMQGLEDDGAPTIAIGSATGRATRLPRPLVAALTAELRLKLADGASDALFGKVELLDFPGAMARSQLAEARGASLLYRRGKVAYLFQRYVADQELAAIVLCVDHGNQQVKTLPGMIKDWIDATHGATPAERAKTACSLYVALTKFDLEFKMGGGKREDEPGRWSNRLRTVFTEFLCQEHPWHEEWTPGKAFDNVYWTRNPSLEQLHLVEYDPSRRETGFRDREKLEGLRDLFAATTEVRRHFADPVRSWNEGLRLNDGGVAYLAERLSPVCDPKIKLDQIEARLAALSQALRARISPFYISSDVAKEQAKRGAEVRRAIEGLRNVVNTKRLALLVRNLQAPRGAFVGPFLKVQEEKQPGVVDDKYVDMPDYFAAAAVEDWDARMRAFAVRGDLDVAVGLERADLETIIKTLETAAGHFRLRDAVGARIRPHYAPQRGARERVRTPAFVAETVVNDFVATFGFAEAPESERPRLRRAGGGETPIFEADSAETGPEIFLDDWRAALEAASRIGLGAAALSARQQEANAALGKLVDGLEAT